MNWKIHTHAHKHARTHTLIHLSLLTLDYDIPFLTSCSTYLRLLHRHHVPFRPDELSLHPSEPRVVVGLDQHDDSKRLYVSRNFGESWSTTQAHVNSFSWGVPPFDPDPLTLYIERKEPSESMQNEWPNTREDSDGCCCWFLFIFLLFVLLLPSFLLLPFFILFFFFFLDTVKYPSSARSSYSYFGISWFLVSITQGLQRYFGLRTRLASALRRKCWLTTSSISTFTTITFSPPRRTKPIWIFG